MAQSGVSTIDALIDDLNAPPIVNTGGDRPAVSVVQDLLRAHGVNGMPRQGDTSHGSFGPTTTAAVRHFQQTHGLPVVPASNPQVATVDAATLRTLATAPTQANATPTASRGYLTLTLGFPFTGMVRVVSITTEFEGGGRFGAQNRNTDGAGLSYGLIQWAQKPRRLHDILSAFQTEEPQLFASIFGDGDATLVQRMVAHTNRTNGGVANNGATTDAAFNLITNPWTGRFSRAALVPALQQVQVRTALAAFNKSFEILQGFASEITSERGVAFMLDVANQHGDSGARNIFRTVRQAQPNLSAAGLLAALANESVRRVAAQFGANSAEVHSTRTRRDAFRLTPVLSDEFFDPE
jgi:peptidoglycan hydrolase-like protein with peptidoglycan-binding domain